MNDKYHKIFINEQITLVLSLFEKYKSVKKIINNHLCILERKKIITILKNNFDINIIDKILKQERYERKIFICIKCKNKFIQRQSNGICSDCKDEIYKENSKKFYCKICNKKIRNTINGLCQNCLRHTKQGKKILSKIYKGMNKGNPGWARVKIKNGYIENRVSNKLRINNFKIVCQKQFKRFRVDIFLSDHNIIIECDGKQHYENIKIFNKDKIRDKELIELGNRIIRFNAYFIQLLIDDVLIKINEFIYKKSNREINYCDKEGNIMGI